MTQAEAEGLTQAGRCTWACLYARDLICACRCGGPYHGARRHARKPTLRLQYRFDGTYVNWKYGWSYGAQRTSRQGTLLARCINAAGQDAGEAVIAELVPVAREAS